MSECLDIKYVEQDGDMGFICHLRQYTDTQPEKGISSFPFVYWNPSHKVAVRGLEEKERHLPDDDWDVERMCFSKLKNACS